MKELILGGDGLIGNALARILANPKNVVTSIDIKNGTDAKSLDANFYKRFDRIWFLAWDTGGAKYISPQQWQHTIYKNNLALTERVLDNIYQSKIPFLFTTSQLATSGTAYGLTKLVAENWSKEIGGKIARLWNVYGWEIPNIKSHVVTDLVLSGLKNNKIRLMTNGTEKRRFIYKTDCAQALLSFFDSSEIQEIDIAGTKWITIAELAKVISEELQMPLELGYEKGEEVLIEPHKTLPHWEPTTNLKDGIKLVISDARQFLLNKH